MMNKKFMVILQKTHRSYNRYVLDKDGKLVNFDRDSMEGDDIYSIVLAHVTDPFMETLKYYMRIPLDNIMYFIDLLSEIRTSDDPIRVPKEYVIDGIWCAIDFSYDHDEEAYIMEASYLDRSPTDPLYKNTIKIYPKEMEDLITEIKKTKRAAMFNYY